MSILLFMLFCLGASQLWSHSKIFGPVRIMLTKYEVLATLRRGLLCPPCSSFWVALLLAIIINPTGTPLMAIPLATINYLLFGILVKKNILTDD